MGRPEAAPKSEAQIAKGLRPCARQVLDTRERASKKEDDLFTLLKVDLGKVGKFYRSEDGGVLFFRSSERRLYEVTTTPGNPFGDFVTWLADLSVSNVILKRSLERLRAWTAQEGQTVRVQGVAYNTSDAEIVAINDFGGGMWYRHRGGSWLWKPNGAEGILFWTFSDLVESWKPEFSTTPTIHDADHLTWFLQQPHFADDILTANDQRSLLRALLVTPFFPALGRVRPVQAHLGLSQQRQHDTGKTTAGKMIGLLFSGSKFEPMPSPESSDKGVEAVQLELMHKPFVLLDNVDTDITWLKDFLCTYATGARPTKRRLYTDTQQVHIEYRGSLCITSRKAKFAREDVASRTIPFRFKPIAPTERKTEGELLNPVIERRGRLWAGLLDAIARVQDALPTLAPPSPSLRLADFEKFGWNVSKVFGEEKDWETAMIRLKAAQAGVALEDEPLFTILGHLLKDGDIPEQPTKDFHKAVKQTATELDLELGPPDAASCTKRINSSRELLEARLDITITTRTLNGHTLIQVSRGPSWDTEEVTEVTDLGGLLNTQKVKK